jgi:hypothetical protein
MAFPYIVYCPRYYDKSGGRQALHRFAFELSQAGQEVYSSTPHQADRWRIPYADRSKIEQLAAQGGIAVYPEIVYGNPFATRTVVRWELNRRGAMGGPLAYEPTDLIYGYSRVFGNYDDDKILYLQFYNLDIMVDKKLPRVGRVYYVGKGTSTPRIPETEGATEITKHRPRKKGDLAQLFQTSSLFICYDAVTALIDEALLCGCPVVVVPGHISYDDFYKSDSSRRGVAWGMAGAAEAAATVDSLYMREKVYKNYDNFKKNIILFIRDTQAQATKNNQ